MHPLPIPVPVQASAHVNLSRSIFPDGRLSTLATVSPILRRRAARELNLSITGVTSHTIVSAFSSAKLVGSGVVVVVVCMCVIDGVGIVAVVVVTTELVDAVVTVEVNEVEGVIVVDSELVPVVVVSSDVDTLVVVTELEAVVVELAEVVRVVVAVDGPVALRGHHLHTANKDPWQFVISLRYHG